MNDQIIYKEKFYKLLNIKVAFKMLNGIKLKHINIMQIYSFLSDIKNMCLTSFEYLMKLQKV